MRLLLGAILVLAPASQWSISKEVPRASRPPAIAGAVDPARPRIERGQLVTASVRKGCLVVSLAGFAGTMTMSAVKRDRGVSDYGTLVQGHAGVLDRIDSICFAAPVFFHITRYFFSKL